MIGEIVTQQTVGAGDRRGVGGREAAVAGLVRRVEAGDVSRHDEHGHLVAREGVLDRHPQEAGHLRRLADHLAVSARVHEQPLRMRFLEEAGANAARGDVRCDRQHGHALALRVV